MYKMLSTTSLSQWSIKIPRMGLKGRNAMGTMVPWHRTIPINCGRTSIFPGLHNKSAKAKRKKFINLKLKKQNKLIIIKMKELIPLNLFFLKMQFVDKTKIIMIF